MTLKKIARSNFPYHDYSIHPRQKIGNIERLCEWRHASVFKHETRWWTFEGQMCEFDELNFDDIHCKSYKG